MRGSREARLGGAGRRRELSGTEGDEGELGVSMRGSQEQRKGEKVAAGRRGSGAAWESLEESVHEPGLHAEESGHSREKTHPRKSWSLLGAFLSSGLHLSHEFPVTLPANVNQLFDGYYIAIFEPGFVDITEATGTDQSIIMEAIGSLKEISKGEVLQGLPKGGKRE